MLGPDAEPLGTTQGRWMIACIERDSPSHFTSSGCYLLFARRSAIGIWGTGDSPCTLLSMAIDTKEYDDQRACSRFDRIVLIDDHATIHLQPSRPMGVC